MSARIESMMRTFGWQAMADEYVDWMAEPANVDRATDDCLSALFTAHLNGVRIVSRQRIEKRVLLPAGSLPEVHTGANGLSKKMLNELATLDWVTSGKNLVITGGTGKSFIGAALVRHAIDRDLRVEYKTVPELFELFDIADAKNLAAFRRLLGRYSKLDLLVIDDFALARCNEAQAGLLHRLLTMRARRKKSTVILSPLDPAKWTPRLHKPTLAKSIRSSATNAAIHVSLTDTGRVSAA